MTYGEKYKSASAREKAFKKFCDALCCGACPDAHRAHMQKYAFRWLEMEIQEQICDCPFCGKPCDVKMEECEQVVVYCQHCGYKSGRANSIAEAKRIHNDFCRKIKRQKK